MDYVDTLLTDSGTLTFRFKLHTPQFPNEELPDPPYIFIDWMKAEPSCNRILQRCAGEVIARIRAKLNSNRTIIFQPANGQMGNDQKQKQLEAYYRSCGFDFLPSSATKFWMTWREKA